MHACTRHDPATARAAWERIGAPAAGWRRRSIAQPGQPTQRGNPARIEIVILMSCQALKADATGFRLV